MGLLNTLRTWLRLPVPYRAKDYAGREEFGDDYRLIAAALVQQLDFDSVIDLGCANGLLLLPFLEAGKEVRGIELSPHVRQHLPPQLEDRVMIGDFSAMDGHADLVCCVEVAEHLPPGRSEELVDTITSCARKWVYFTAAPPGQGGRGHINCRPMTDWVAWFEARGWRPSRDTTAALVDAMQGLNEALWLRNNSIVFRG